MTGVYTRKAVSDLQTARWRPRWELMEKVCEWLGESGAVYEWKSDDNGLELGEEGLPQLVMWDSRWDFTLVRFGDYLVKHGQSDIRVIPAHQFREEYEGSGA